MREATGKVAAWLGIAAGLAGIEHGYFEILQGGARPESLMIASMGTPCIPEQAWNRCEPALTLLPTFLVTGIAALILGLVILVWSAAFLRRKSGSWILMGLCGALLVCGGGFFPPLIGLVGGLCGLAIHKPLDTGAPGKFIAFAAKIWPWPLALLMVWLVNQFTVGYFFNDFLQRFMAFGVVLILLLLPLSVLVAYAHDRARQGAR
ncbi:hypothetical protein [Longilinea arvoryzae]|nr:hypothetical protein [Longilinea arvoryzae]